MENTENTNSAWKELNDYIHRLEDEKSLFIKKMVGAMSFLFFVLILIFMLFSYKFEGKFHLDSNGTTMLWITVVLDIAVLIWLSVRSFIQIKRYRICIRKLGMLSLKASLDKEYNRKKMLEDVQSIMGVFEKEVKEKTA